jgi:hypothetical protein
MGRLFRLSEHQAKAGRKRSKFRSWYKSKVDLQGVREQKHPVNPRARVDIQMMQGKMICIHSGGPVRECFLHVVSVPDAESKIDIYI